MKFPLVVNLLAGPGAGKSTMAARIFSELKMKGVNCELVVEYAKELTYQESWKVLQNQIYVFAKQHKRMFSLAEKVDVIITDSPFFLAHVYDSRKNQKLVDLIMQENDRFNNLYYFIERSHEYKVDGRNESLQEALEIDQRIKKSLGKYNINYENLVSSIESCAQVTQEVVQKLQNNRSAYQVRLGAGEQSTGFKSALHNSST